MPVTRKDACEFYYLMAKHTAATMSQCQRLLRLAATLHRLDVERTRRPETERDKAKALRLVNAVLKLCGEIAGNEHVPFGLKPETCGVVFTYEPMAPPFIIIRTPDGFSNYAGDVAGIGVPA